MISKENKRIQITLPSWAINELENLLNSDLCKDRGFKMTKSDLITEMIANYGRLIVGNQNGK